MTSTAPIGARRAHTVRGSEGPGHGSQLFLGNVPFRSDWVDSVHAG